VALFEYLRIPQEQITILATLMIIDFITGVGKQYRIDRHKITSHAAWIGAMKKVATLTAVLSIALIFKGIKLDGSAWINGALAIFIMSEGYSIIQNIYAIRTGKILPEFDAISLLIKSFGDFIKYRIENAVKTAIAPDTKKEKPEEK
jgi:toxin secretion/phage lysis holin